MEYTINIKYKVPLEQFQHFQLLGIAVILDLLKLNNSSFHILFHSIIYFIFYAIVGINGKPWKLIIIDHTSCV